MESQLDPAPTGSGEHTRAKGKAGLGGALPWAQNHAADLVNAVVLGALALLIFVLDLDSIGIGGDAIRKWHFVRQWFYANDIRHGQWDHHMARVGMNVIAYVSQAILGRGPLVYYVPALLAGVVTVIATYACGKRLGGRFVGILAALMLIAFKPEHTATTQFLPEVFSGMYAIIAAYLLLRYADAVPERRTPWLVASSVVLFAGYLAKETTVYFIPGFVVAIWLVPGPRRYRDIGLFLGVLLGGVLIETACYRIFTNYAHRFAVVSETHALSDTEIEDELGNLLDRYEKATPPWRFAFYLFLATSLAVVAFARSLAATNVVLIGASYFFFLTFLVRSLHPLKKWQTFQSRYLDSGAPFVFLTHALFVLLIVQVATAAVRARPRGEKWLGRFAKLARFSPALVPVVALVIGAVVYEGQAKRLDEHPFRVLPQAARVLNDAYRRNLPIVSVRNLNGLWAAYSVLINDKLLARDGQLPSYDEVKLEWNGQTFIVKDPAAYSEGDKLKRMQRKHCAVEVMGKEGYSYVKPMTPLRPECDAEQKRP
jgi:4-amino-4-deoxy-L-arabinose transferase-like glycosyltransferase